MAERIDSAYMRLFEIRLYHHYWLDNGITLFEQIPEQDKSDRYLREYDIRSFLTLEPTVATTKRLTGLRGVIRNTALGCIVGVPSQDVISRDMPDITLDFVVTVRSADLLLVMHEGQIAERGTHAELLARHGRYAHLYELQFGGGR